MTAHAWVREEDLEGRPSCLCLRCHQLVVEAPGVGWIDPIGGSYYDMCPTDALGNHAPDLARVRPFEPPST